MIFGLASLFLKDPCFSFFPATLQVSESSLSTQQPLCLGYNGPTARLGFLTSAGVFEAFGDVTRVGSSRRGEQSQMLKKLLLDGESKVQGMVVSHFTVGSVLHSSSPFCHPDKKNKD